MAVTLRMPYSAYANSIASVSVVANDLIIVCASYNETLAAVSCSDNASGGTNAYSEVGTGLDHPAGLEGDSSGHMFYAIAKATETLTVTVSNHADAGMSVHVVSGNNTTLGSVLNTYNVKADTSEGTSHSSESITTDNANDYLICFWFQEHSASTHTENGTSFTIRSEESTHAHATFDRIVTGKGTYSDAITTSASVRYGSIIAAFKAAAAGAAVISGTATEGITEADIVAGGKTIIVTLSGDTLIAS